MFSVHTKTKPSFSNSSGLKSALVKIRFRDSLVRWPGRDIDVFFFSATFFLSRLLVFFLSASSFFLSATFFISDVFNCVRDILL